MRFIILGDLHYATYSNPETAAARDRFFYAFFRQVAAQQADAVFAIGDTTHVGTLEELQGLDEIVNNVGLKLVRLVGNHDNNSHEKHEIAPYFLNGARSAGEDGLYHAFTVGEVRFVLLDSARVKLSDTDYSGIIHTPQLEWLSREIAQFNATPSTRYLVAMAHHPINNTTHGSEDPMLQIVNSPEVVEIFAQVQRKPAFYICGHNHSHSLFGPDANDWYHVQTGAPMQVEGYRLVTAELDSVRVETIDIDFSPPGLRADFDTTRHNFEKGFSLNDFIQYYGTFADREFILEVSA
jgi:DNA repair exonuclease SbcCD nuclease subunit